MAYTGQVTLYKDSTYGHFYLVRFFLNKTFGYNILCNKVKGLKWMSHSCEMVRFILYVSLSLLKSNICILFSSHHHIRDCGPDRLWENYLPVRPSTTGAFLDRNRFVNLSLWVNVSLWVNKPVCENLFLVCRFKLFFYL